MLPRIPFPHLDAAPDTERRFRFLETVRRCLRERRYSRRTEEAYVHWIKRYVLFNDRRHPRAVRDTCRSSSANEKCGRSWRSSTIPSASAPP
jgi:hypothetical protein